MSGGTIAREARLLALRAWMSRQQRVGRRLGGRIDATAAGRRLLRHDPDAIARLSRRLPQGTAVVTGTNGKTTTLNLAAAAFAAAAIEPVCNRVGNNVDHGVATELLAASRVGGRLRGSIGLFEVDELWLTRLVGGLDPRALLVTNIVPDANTDSRGGSRGLVVSQFVEVIEQLADDAALILCADDSVVSELPTRHREVMWYGLHGVGTPPPPVCARDVVIDGVAGSSFVLRGPWGEVRMRLQVPGAYNVSNATAAAALCHSQGVEIAVIADAFARVSPVFMRGERVTVGDREVVMFLVKNPAGADEVFGLLGAVSPDGFDLLWLLAAQTGAADAAWVGDVGPAPLGSGVRRATCGGPRATDAAAVLAAAGVPTDRIEVAEAVDDALDRALVDGEGPLYAIGNLAPMEDLRELLADRRHVERYWP